jgi:hypothetical protein
MKDKKQSILSCAGWFLVTTLRLLSYSLYATVRGIVQPVTEVARQIGTCNGEILRSEIEQLKELLQLAGALFLHLCATIGSLFTEKGKRREHAVHAIQLAAYLLVTLGMSLVTAVLIPCMVVSLFIRICILSFRLSRAKPGDVKETAGKPMHTNIMMRLACMMLIGTTLTSSIVSSTFAKYTSKGKWGDSARIAKWGVGITSSGLLFPEDALQPGREGSAEFDLAGTPEVAVEISAEIKAQDIYLNEGTYAVMTPAEEEDLEVLAEKGYLYEKNKDGSYVQVGADDIDGDSTYYRASEDVTVDKDYYPVEYTLTSSSGGITSDGATKATEIAEILDKAINKSGTSTYDADTDLADAVGLTGETLSWEWKDNSDDEVRQAKDTILQGMISAADGDSDEYEVVRKDEDTYEAVTYQEDSTVTVGKETVASLETDFSIEIEVTQVD